MTLKELREGANMSQTRLAELSGVPQQVISAYERGAKDWRNMPLERAIALADALGVTDLRQLGL
ncbi:helix-turn-helix protein [Bifidobacterium margollesii]|uniref:Helix-turn-helix protein n=2 Tax=Bifidobacterium margollesii TaxID=2020964 RepID=A0A2N5JD17_9BIFI|nr:helix-turn-helix protein [Bifidobacterium margollesii]